MRAMRVCGVISALWLLLVLLACGGSGDEPSTEPAAESPSEPGDPFGLVGAINRDLERASGEIGQAVEQANQEMAEGTAQAEAATEEAEAAMQQAGEQIEAANEAAAQP